MNAWLSNQIGSSAANIITSLVVLVVVIAAIAITIAVLRRFNGGTFVMGGKGRTPRLSVRDAAAVDRTRRLVLVRRDNVEHLILIGGPTDVVIETNIVTGSDLADHRQHYPDVVQASTKDTNIHKEPVLAEPDIEVRRPHMATPRMQSSPTQNINSAVEHASRQPIQPTPSLQNAPLRHDASQDLRDDKISAEIEGRREPSLTVQPNDSTRHVNLGDEFDRMFEDELREAVRVDKP
ncbi:flagellar biosynthetic protein FliO [Bartonella sp. LJL80]